MTNQTKRQYRVRNWRQYNSALVGRGSLTLRVDSRSTDTWLDRDWPACRGRRRTYADGAILCALTLREVYHLPLRATEGLVSSVLRLLAVDLPAPDYSTPPHGMPVQVPDGAMRLGVGWLKEEFKRGGTLHDKLLRYTQGLLLQTSQVAACNRLRSLSERLARWLLMSDDRCRRTDLPFTQEFLSLMLGVRRAGVTEAALILQTEWVRLLSGRDGQYPFKVNSAGQLDAAC